MTRNEFLDGLKESLQGEVAEQVILDQLQYYRSYIDGQVVSGRPESEVLDELGSPRLIARTIIDSEEARAEAQGQTTGQQTYSQTSYQEQSGPTQGAGSFFDQLGGGNQWVRIALIAVAVILVLTCVLGTVSRLLFSPSGIVFLVFVLLYVWYIRSRR